MKLIKVLRWVLLCWFSFWMCASAAFAKDGVFSYTIEAVPSWVKVQTYDPKGFTDKAHGEAPYLLYSRQTRFFPKDLNMYTRQVRRVDQLSGAENVSQITIDFDPLYQSLILHSVNVIRGGKAQKRLTKDGFSLYRVETEADRLIYNGTVTASLVLEDVRVGDMVEYAYSIKGRNSYFEGSIQSSFLLQYGVPIDHHFRRLIVPNTREYHTRVFAGAKDIKPIISGRELVYEWDMHGQDDVDADAGRPAWHYSYPAFQISDFTTWAEVGQWKPEHYAARKIVSSELAARIEEIKASHSTTENRVRAVLDLAQSEIRYLGIELGAGGYIPRDPSLVYARRFGDCKDKTMLMVTMLEHMGIQSSPLLVHTDNKQKLDLSLPNLGAFDHVITKVAFDGHVYYLDPTKGKQSGSLDTLEQPYYGLGVEVGTYSPGLIKIEPRNSYDYTRDVTEVFKVHATDHTITLNVETNLYGDKADQFLRWKDREDRETIQKSYLEQYQKNYPSITVSAPMEFTILPQKAQVTITENYSIPNAWEQDEDTPKDQGMSFSSNPYVLADFIPKLNKTPRTSPLSLKHRANVRHTLRFEVPSGWEFGEKTIDIDNDSFHFKKVESFENDIYQEVYTYRSKRDHIPAKTHQADMQDRDKLGNVYGITLMSGDQYVHSSDSDIFESFGDLITGLLGLLFLALIFFAGYMTAKQKYA